MVDRIAPRPAKQEELQPDWPGQRPARFCGAAIAEDRHDASSLIRALIESRSRFAPSGRSKRQVKITSIETIHLSIPYKAGGATRMIGSSRANQAAPLRQQSPPSSSVCGAPIRDESQPAIRLPNGTVPRNAIM